MKKIITLLLLIFCFSFHHSFAQLEVAGSKEFGRIFDLTYDDSVPGKIYGITLGNHIIVSEDNGKTWDILYSLIRQGSIIEHLKLSEDGTALTFSSHLPNTTLNAVMIYDIASASIIKTFALPNQADLAHVVFYDFFEGSGDVLVVDTNFPVGLTVEGKTFYTADGGKSWSMIYYTNDNSKVFINKVAISPKDPQQLFLTRGNGSQGINGGLLVSKDAGATFEEKLPGVILDPITFDPSNEQTLLLGTGISFGGTVENLYKSTDGGETFNIVPIKWTASILDNITVIKFNKNNPAQLIVMEENEIALSEDGGTSFQNIVYASESPDSYYYGLNASYNPQNAQEMMISSNYIPLFSNDGGQTLTPVLSPYFSSTGNTAVFNNGTEAHLYYGVQYGYVHRDLTTGTDTPHDIRALDIFSNNGVPTFYADRLTPHRVYVFTSSFMGSNLSVSDDNGTTKNQLLSIFKNRLTAVATFPNDPNTILAAFLDSSSGETELKKIEFGDLNNITEANLALPATGNITGILIDAAGKITLSVGIEVYASVDGGVTWTNESKGLEVFTENDLILDIEQDLLNENRLAVASSQGIFISEDGGASWSQKTTELVHNIAFSTENEGALVASTFSSRTSEFAIHYTTDGGENWQTITNEQLLGIGSGSSAYLFEDGYATVFAGSDDIGLVAYKIAFEDLSVPGFEHLKNGLTIYPNPVSDRLYVNLKAAHVENIKVYSLSGAEVLEATDDSSVNVSTLKTGIYLLRVQNDAHQVLFKKFIKN